MTRQWTIHQVAQAAGTTSRTLRHYDAIGILHPTTIAANGYRMYDASALVRLQRILAMRDLGMSLAEIGAVLDEDVPEITALTDLHQRLEREAGRLQRQIATVQRTLAALRNGGQLMADEMFDGFHHEQHKDEVEERWGADAYARADTWWHGLGADHKQAFQQRMEALNHDWRAAAEAGVEPASDTAQDLAARHVAWLQSIPNTMTPTEFRQYVLRLGQMYVDDPRFASNYGGETGATLVRDALALYTENRRS